MLWSQMKTLAASFIHRKDLVFDDYQAAAIADIATRLDVYDNEVAAAAFGKNVALIKTLAVAISSALCAVAGVLYAFHISFVNPESFTIDQSVLVMAMIIIGGTGTVLGPILGALIIHLLPAGLTYLSFLPSRDIASLQQIIYGAAMVLLMIYRPSGLIGKPLAKDTWSK